MSAQRPRWGLLSRRNSEADTATELYGRLVARARNPVFYASLGVPDTPEGRLELIIMHVMLMLRRLHVDEMSPAPTAPLLARELGERFVVDMDDCLREMGVGDIAVAKKVKKAAAALFDRMREYGPALAAGDQEALARHLSVHILEQPPSDVGANARRIAAYAIEIEAALAQASVGDIVTDRAVLPDIAI